VVGSNPAAPTNQSNNLADISRIRMTANRFGIATPIDFSFSAAAARSDLDPAPWRRPFLNWLDGIEAGWAVPLLLVGFVVVWVAFLIIAYLSGDPHPDVLEAWSVGRTWAWGHAKHPPLMGWVAHLWTAIFPLTNWSMQLFAMVNSAMALWFVDLISRRFVRGDKRIIVLLLLLLTPAYQFHAQRFNANTVLLATWPLATWCFLRSFESRSLLWAVAAGATAALAVLGKYYSVFLIGGFASREQPIRESFAWGTNAFPRRSSGRKAAGGITAHQALR
jgi:hypothetical protein